MSRTSDSTGIIFHQAASLLVLKVITVSMLTLIIATVVRFLSDEALLFSLPIALLTIVLFHFLLFCALFTAWRRIRYVITSDFVIIRKGLIVKNERSIPIANINSIRTHQSILGGILEYGDVTIEYGESKLFTICSVQNPDQFLFLIETIQSSAR